jgi:phage tail-like protein
MTGTAAPLSAPGAGVMDEAAERMFASLPVVFRSRDKTGDLAKLLGVLGSFFFTGATLDGRLLPGLEQHLEDLPALFSPLGANEDPSATERTPDPFLHWLATWLSFTPHELFSPERLRGIVGGIVPLYGLRGTRGYLVRLLKLCFGDEVARIDIDDRPHVGFTVGESRLGVDTRLAVSRPFCFKVAIGLHPAPAGPLALERIAALQHRLRAVIDFAKPAHTIYELEWRTHRQTADTRDQSPV